MSDAEKIAAVLAEHQWYDASSMEADDPAIGCIGCDDWFGSEDALDDGTFAAHQAAQLAPVVREAQAAAWMEGWQQGTDTHCDADDCDITDTNPYREES